jgi:hypothetical protein
MHFTNNWLTQILSPLRDFAFHNLTNLEARVLTLQLANPRNEISRVIQWFLSTQILRSDFPNLKLENRLTVTPLLLCKI